ncbi:Piwi domain-containing protein [Cladochytrium replicatum]|nr:Piwi domain-containing protein [Cladochytrium replicatum]
MGISLTFGGFQEDGPLETCVRNIVGHGPPWNVRDIQQANRRLKGLTIKIRGPLERKKKLATIMTENALTYSFKNEHKTRTVQQYFLERYNVRLARPELNLVRFGMDTAIPMELCHIEPGQFARGRLNAEQTRRMLDLAKKAPSAYQNLIKAAQRGMFSSVPFNLATENEPVSVNGMRLISPDIQFKDGHTINDKEKESASWNIRDRRVIHGLSLKIWMLVNVGERHHERISGFIEEFGSAMEKNGLMGMKRPIDVEHINPHQLDDFIVRFPNQAGLQMVIWLLDSEDSQMYAKIKRFCDVKLGSPSQCMQKAKIFRGNKVDPSYLGNIALKINLKLGGNNWSLLRNQVPILASAPTMIVGADVSHPSAMERAFGQPSIAAVVASMSWRGDFATSLRLLPHRPGSRAVMDIITNLHEMMMEQFCRFRDLVGCAPRKVIFFRDGIDAGAFQYARDIELAAVRSAFFEVFEGQTGDITFLILNKRHQARFFPARSQDAINGKPGANVKPGTYVDSNVTIPGNLGFDFYLISHASPLGTARPVHYHVLEDDSHFSADELIDLGNKLAYNYQRATKGVKLPAPVYLAHLACKRATCYFDNATEGSEAASSSSDPTELYNRFSQNFRIPPEHLLRVPFYA